MTLQAVEDAPAQLSKQALCRALGVARSQLYRKRQPVVARPPRPPSPLALTAAERETVRDTLNSPPFQDQAPRQVFATLLDQGVYLCAWSTMYRILRQHNEVRERRDQLRHPAYTRPELLATEPRQLWSWDITKLKGAQPWTYYYLYVIMDVFSRYVVGWMIMERESATLAEAFIAETCAQEGITPDQLTLHADRGSSMTSKTVAQLLMDLGVTKTHSRPHVSNDNPFSEAQFKTLKYRPDYPKDFGSVADARAWTRQFIQWYNEHHHHSGLGLLTPAVVHHGATDRVRTQRQQVLDVAHAAHPERFVRGAPRVADGPCAVWINPPLPTPESGAAVELEATSTTPTS